MNAFSNSDESFDFAIANMAPVCVLIRTEDREALYYFVEAAIEI
jgi:hypothetical protein